MNNDSLQLGKQCPHLHFLLTFLSRTNLAEAQSENPLKDGEGKLRERREQVLKTNADKGLVFNDGDMIVNEAQEKEGGRELREGKGDSVKGFEEIVFPRGFVYLIPFSSYCSAVLWTCASSSASYQWVNSFIYSVS